MLAAPHTRQRNTTQAKVVAAPVTGGWRDASKVASGGAVESTDRRKEPPVRPKPAFTATAVQRRTRATDRCAQRRAPTSLTPETCALCFEGPRPKQHCVCFKSALTRPTKLWNRESSVTCEAPIGSEASEAEDLTNPTAKRRTDDPEVASLLNLLGRVNASTPSLPPRPEVVAEIMTLLQDPRADSKRLARLVHGDPALAAQVLRVANSPAWRGRARIVTLQQAVARLGMGVLQEIVLSAAISGVYQVKGHEEMASNVWRHAIGTALFSKATARLRRENVESAFIGGLLHSVGRPVALWELIRQLRRKRMNATPSAVRTAVGLGHERVGLALAEAWQLPDVVQSVIAHVSEPGGATEHITAVQTVAFGAEVAQRALQEDSTDLIPDSPEQLVPFAHSEALDLYPKDVISILQQTPKVLAAIRAMST